MGNRTFDALSSDKKFNINREIDGNLLMWAIYLLLELPVVQQVSVDIVTRIIVFIHEK